MKLIVLLFCGNTSLKINLAGADPGFFLGGGALVSCSTSTPINHIVFFWRIPVVLENRRSSQGGVRTPCTLPLDPPLFGLFIKLFIFAYFFPGKNVNKPNFPAVSCMKPRLVSSQSSSLDRHVLVPFKRVDLSFQ